MFSKSSNTATKLIAERMNAAGLPSQLIDAFLAQYSRLRQGESGRVPWEEISPPQEEDIVDLGTLALPDDAERQRLLGQLVCIRLNGGLGTSMELARAKSLISVREEETFLSLAAAQVRSLRERYEVTPPLLLMNSFRTREDSLRALGSFPQPGGLPLDFLQHKVPRIERATGLPLSLEGEGPEEEEWTPPGHGDLYLALYLSDLLERLVAQGYRWAFVANIDNLAATVDLSLLSYLDRGGIQFAMEVTEKTAADVKGGTLIRRQGRLELLERTQVEEAHQADFEDTSRLQVFNTNSLWWRLEPMLARLKSGRLDLPLIVNPKTVHGRDVLQLETAMGAAIGLFSPARGIRVPRSRFAPVKTTEDLLAVRSDAYVVDEAGAIQPNPDRPNDLGPPVIKLDPTYYKGIEAFDARFPHPLGLVACKRLTVDGDVHFGRNVTIEGSVTIRNKGEKPGQISDGVRLVETEVVMSSAGRPDAGG